MRALTRRFGRSFLAISLFLTLCFVISCNLGGRNPLFLVDGIYAVANSLEDIRSIELEGGGRADIEVIRDLGNPVPALRRALEGKYSRVLVSPFLADAAESLSPDYPGIFFGLMRYRVEEGGISDSGSADTGSGGNTVELVLDRGEAVVSLAERISEEVEIRREDGRKPHILGIWGSSSEADRKELELFRETLSDASDEGFAVEIRPVGAGAEIEDLEAYIREEIVDTTVLGLCFAGPADVLCARIFWEYGIPVATEGLSSTLRVWGPVAYTLSHDVVTVLRVFRSINPEESPVRTVIEASIAPSKGPNS
jgi:hypothetical protein